MRNVSAGPAVFRYDANGNLTGAGASGAVGGHWSGQLAAACPERQLTRELRYSTKRAVKAAIGSLTLVLDKIERGIARLLDAEKQQCLSERKR